jgi:hypothetical protein
MEPCGAGTSLAFNGRSEACSVSKTLAAATKAPTGLPRSRSRETGLTRAAPLDSVSRPFVSRGLAVDPPACGQSTSRLIKHVGPCGKIADCSTALCLDYLAGLRRICRS